MHFHDSSRIISISNILYCTISHPDNQQILPFYNHDSQAMFPYCSLPHSLGNGSISTSAHRIRYLQMQDHHNRYPDIDNPDHPRSSVPHLFYNRFYSLLLPDRDLSLTCFPFIPALAIASPFLSFALIFTSSSVEAVL